MALLALFPAFSIGQTAQPSLQFLGEGLVRQPAVWDLDWHPSGQYLASAAAWDLDIWSGMSIGNPLTSITRTTAQDPKSLRYSPDGTKLVTVHASGGCTLYMYDVDSATGAVTLAHTFAHASGGANSETIREVAWSPDGTRIAVVDNNKKMTLYLAANGTMLHQIGSAVPGVSSQSYYVYPESVQYSPDGSKIATCGGDGKVHLWSSADLSAIASSTDAHGACVPPPGSSCDWRCSSLDFTEDGTQIVTGGMDEHVMRWDATTLARTMDIFVGYSVYAGSLSPDGRYFAGVGGTTLSVVDIPYTGTNDTLTFDAGNTYSVAWSPDMTKIATGSWDKTVKIYGTALPAYSGPSPDPSTPPPPPPLSSVPTYTSGNALVHVESGGNIIVKSGATLTIGE